jgi:hypothetical protein
MIQRCGVLRHKLSLIGFFDILDCCDPAFFDITAAFVVLRSARCDDALTTACKER